MGKKLDKQVSDGQKSHCKSYCLSYGQRDNHFSYAMFQEDPTDKLGLAQQNPISES